LHNRRHFTGEFSRQIAMRPSIGAFIPSTRGADGDPVDAMILNDLPTYPCILVRCRPIGMVELVRRESKRELNNRIVLLPRWRDAHLEEASELPGEVGAQVENFFVSCWRARVAAGFAFPAESRR
jgi:inorganic pyrophosphatase